jgi:hypothetical protein
VGQHPHPPTRPPVPAPSRSAPASAQVTRHHYDFADALGSSLLEPPVGALQGVSEGDADLLKHAFNIKAVGDLGKNKYFRAAQLLTQLAEAGAK